MWIDPVIFAIGPLEVRWYGLVYALGFLLSGWWIGKNKQKLGLEGDEPWDLIFYSLVGGIIGARLFEAFWEPMYYLGNPINFLKIWQGGMSFHGGIVGGILAVWWLCRKRKWPLAKILDIGALPFALFMAFGRIANFINSELLGRAWSGSWCVDFGDGICRHPSTLYASVKRFIVFGGLVWLNKLSQFKPGFIFWNYVFFEGLGRIIVDFYRSENVYYFGLTMGQLLSLVMVIVSLIVFWKFYKKDWKKLFK